MGLWKSLDIILKSSSRDILSHRWYLWEIETVLFLTLKSLRRRKTTLIITLLLCGSDQLFANFDLWFQTFSIIEMRAKKITSLFTHRARLWLCVLTIIISFLYFQIYPLLMLFLCIQSWTVFAPPHGASFLI